MATAPIASAAAITFQLINLDTCMLSPVTASALKNTLNTLTRSQRCQRTGFAEPGALQIVAASSHQKHAFAAGLLVKQLIGLFSLIESPGVREQLVDINLALGDEAGAVGLAGS